MNEKTPGQVAFEAYNESKGGLTYDGKPIPPWASLTDATGEAVRRGWEVAAHAVLASYDAQLDARPDRLIDRARSSTETHGGKSRETSLALTKLDEAAMWFARAPMQAP